MTRILLIALLVGLLVYLYRRRLGPAVKVGLGLYVGLALFRVAQATSDDRPVEAVAGLAAFAAVWLLLWTLVRVLERRRSRKASTRGEQVDPKRGR